MYTWSEKQIVLDAHVRALLPECGRLIRAAYPDAGIILYGSQARGQAGPQSDLDLLVLLPGVVSPAVTRHIREMLYEVGLREDLVISVIVRNQHHWHSPFCRAMPLYQNIEREGILLS